MERSVYRERAADEERATNDHNGNAGALEGFRRFPGQFLLGEVENRGGILFRCPRSLALLHSTPSVVERILQATNLVRMENVRRKLL